MVESYQQLPSKIMKQHTKQAASQSVLTASTSALSDIRRQSTHAPSTVQKKDQFDRSSTVRVVQSRYSLVKPKKKKRKPKSIDKPKVTAEQLKASVQGVFSKADKDGNGDLDLEECRAFLQKLMKKTYSEKEWSED